MDTSAFVVLRGGRIFAKQRWQKDLNSTIKLSTEQMKQIEKAVADGKKVKVIIKVED